MSTTSDTPETDITYENELRKKCKSLERERNEHITRNNESLLKLHIATAERDEARKQVQEYHEAAQRACININNLQKERDEARRERDEKVKELLELHEEAESLTVHNAQLEAERDALRDELAQEKVRLTHLEEMFIPLPEGMRVWFDWDNDLRASLDISIRDPATKGNTK